MALLKKAKMKRNSKSDIVFICVMLSVPVLHFALFWLYINIDTVFLSFQKFDLDTGEWVWFGFGNYKLLWHEFTKVNSVLPRAMLNSFSVFLWNDFVIVPVSLFFAYVLYKKVPLGGVFKIIFFLPSIISVVVLTLTFSFMFDASFGFVPNMLDKIGLGSLVPFDGYFGDKKYAWWMILLYGLWSGIGYNIVLVTGAMTRIPQDVIEAGKLDGLTMWRELFSVTIPMIGSTLGTLLLLGTTTIFTYFLQPKLLLGTNAENVGGYTIALYIVNNVRDAGTPQIPLGATMGILCAAVGTPIVFGSRKLIDRFLPAYEY
ncbi:MAG: sugar ABC transporter permease [Clostridia bacterium]|nr:sugar ABC transporter permease [Clostridia bacterium]